MTDVRMRMLEQHLTAQVVTSAAVSWVPTSAVGVASGLLLPAPKAISIQGGPSTVTVEPCDGTAGWGWQVTTTVDGVVRDVRVVLVPASGTVDFEDLAVVDPVTLTTATAAAWETIAAAAGASAGSAAASAAAAAASAASITPTIPATPLTAVERTSTGAVKATGATGYDELATLNQTRTSLRPGNRCVWVGDSLSAWNDSEANNLQRTSLANFACILSGQRLRYAYNAAAGGTTTATMLANFDSVVPAQMPTVVHILGGTNDSAYAVSQTIDNLAGIVKKCRTIGATPVLGTPPPKGTPDANSSERHRLAALRIAILDYAQAEGLLAVDYYGIMVDPATGDMKAAYNRDGTHPTDAGFVFMGQLCAATIAPLLPAMPPPLCVNNVDPRNLISNGLFLTGGATGTGQANWTGGTGAGITNSTITTDTEISGNWVHIAAAGSSSTAQVYQTIATAPIPGHRYLFAGRMKTTWTSGANGITIRVGITASGNPEAGAFYNVAAAITNGVFAIEYVCPAGATSQMVSVSMVAGTMSVDVAQMTLWDLTAAYAVTG